MSTSPFAANAATAEAFGVRFGEAVGEPPAVYTDNDWHSLHRISRISEKRAQLRNKGKENRRFGTSRLLGARVDTKPNVSGRNWTSVPLSTPFFGITSASVSRDDGCKAFEVSVRGAFRRGLTRKESLEKIEKVRNETSRRIGFDIGEYMFSAHDNGNGILASAGGTDLWMDIDTVYANCTATNGNVVVEVHCSVNPPKSNRVRDNNTNGNHLDIDSICGTDSRIAFSVKATDISLADAYATRLQEEAKREDEELQREAEHEEMLDNLTLSDFYGVKFGKPSGISTNSLAYKETKDSRTLDGKEYNCLIAHWERVDESLRPADFFDRAEISYTYRTLTPMEVVFRGHFPKETAREECLARVDELVSDIKAKYKFELLNEINRSNYRCRGKAEEGKTIADRIFSNRHLYISLSVTIEDDGERSVELSARDDATSFKTVEKEGTLKTW